MAETRGPDKKVVHLQVKTGPDAGRIYFLTSKKEALIGRHSSADLRLTDPGASQRHCMVRSAGDVAFVEDLNSRNGTRIQGETISTRVMDEAGIIEVGTSTIELRFVETESALPLAAVQSPEAPTIMEANASSPMAPAVTDPSGRASTILDATQLTEFRAANKLLGRTVGGFLLLEVIGIGNSSVVFRAKQMKTREEAALKLIRNSSARAPQLLQRFMSEIKPNLKIARAVSILASGEDGDYAYIATEIARGRDLHTKIFDGDKYSVKEALAIATPICEALQAAHAQGVVHRYVKPAKILLDKGNIPSLLDLGLGKRTDNEARNIFTRHDNPVLRLAYMSPELTREEKQVDHRTDVYSMAATLFHTISGQQPFTAASPLEVVRKVRWEDPPHLNTVRKDVSEGISNVIKKALSKEPEQRQGSMNEFLDALRNA